MGLEQLYFLYVSSATLLYYFSPVTISARPIFATDFEHVKVCENGDWTVITIKASLGLGSSVPQK